MSQSLPPDKKSSLVAGFVLNTLDELEAQEFEQLMANDPTLVEDVVQLQQSLEISYEVEEVAPPAMLRDRLLSNFAEQSNELADNNLSRSLAQPRRYRNGLKAAVAALAVALTLTNYLWWQSSRQQIARSPAPVTNDRQTQTQTYRLDTTEAGEGGTVSVEIDPETLTATLTASDLPTIGSDQVYVLWTVLAPDAPYTADSKSAILTTTFTVDNQGESQKSLSLPSAFNQPESVAALGVTIESAAAPQAHEGSPVLLTFVQS